MRYYVLIQDNYIKEIFSEGTFVDIPDGFIEANFTNNEILYNIDFVNYKYKVVGNTVILEENQVDRELTHEEVTKQTFKGVETTSFDNLINMDMLLGLDDKLNKIMENLGLEV